MFNIHDADLVRVLNPHLSREILIRLRERSANSLHHFVLLVRPKHCCREQLRQQAIYVHISGFCI